MRLLKNYPVIARRLCALALVLHASLGIAAPAQAPAAKPIRDPHYGDVLFHFYQERYFTSITNLMVSQHFARMPNHGDEAEVLRGGLLLSYGMHREASEIFAKLIERNAAPPVRDRAWYYLAKIRYQRGFIPEADEALSLIQKNLPPELEQDRVLLKANVQMAREDFTGAIATLDGMADVAKEIQQTTPSAVLYARYNLGVALVRSGDSVRGSVLLDQLGRAPTPPKATDEFRSLRDKANVALGFTALKDSKLDDAYRFLERVRLNGLESNKALLGFGWAASSAKDHKRSLVPWLELLDRSATDAAVLEANIAVPYAFSQLGAFGQAHDYYNQALSTFEKENKALDESITGIRAGKLIEGLLERNPGDEMGWFWNIQALPQLPHPGHLSSVLAQHPFQEAFKNYRDLQFLSANLKNWRDTLGVFNDMLDNRRKAYADKLPKVLARSTDLGIQDLSKRAEALRQEVVSAEEKEDGVALATEKERELMKRIVDVDAVLKSAPNDAETATARERRRLAAGALTWNLSQQFAARLWEVKKSMQQVEAGLYEARQREAELSHAQRTEPEKFEAFAKRIAELDKRIQALIPRVASLTQEQQRAAQELAVAELARQKERLAIYTTQARFAVAQLYDRANRGRSAEDGKPLPHMRPQSPGSQTNPQSQPQGQQPAPRGSGLGLSGLSDPDYKSSDDAAKK